MAPAATIDNASGLQPLATKVQFTMPRTLLVAPPSLSSHEEKLNEILEAHDRAATDIQMLDRLCFGLVSLPEATYDVILLLTDANGSRRESQGLLNRNILAQLVRALKASGTLRSQDGSFGMVDGQERNEAILAGLRYEADHGFVKPDYGTQASVPLTFTKKKGVVQAAGGLNGDTSKPMSSLLNGKRKSQEISGSIPAGVGFVDFSDDLDPPRSDDSDDEIIDEDTLLSDEDLNRSVKIRMCLALPLTSIVLIRGPQLLNANLKSARDVELAKTAHVALRRNLKRKTEPNEQTLTQH